MFTDMKNKHYPEEYVRRNLNPEEESTMRSHRNRTKSKEPPSTHVSSRTISVGKSTPNPKAISNSKHDYMKKETSNLKPNAILGLPSYLVTESRCNTKQKQRRTVKKSKQLRQPQRTCDHVENQIFSPCNPHSQVKAAPAASYTSRNSMEDCGIESKSSEVSRRSPATLIVKTAISNGSKSTGLNKPQELMSCYNPRVEINETTISESPRLDSNECKTPTNLMPVMDKQNGEVQEVLMTIDSNLCNIITPNTTCITELTRTEDYCRIQQLVEKAIQNHKIFLIRGDIPYLEKSLRSRGWVQKYESTKTRMVPYGSVASLDAPSLGSIHSSDGTLNEKVIAFQMLRHVPPDFIWDCRNEFTNWNSNIKQTTLLNRFQKSFIYTSKLGMAAILEDAHWNYEEKVSTVQCPRSYNVGREKNAFIEDYRMTAAVSFLKWFVEQIQKGVELAVRGSSPISLRRVEFAIKRCEEFVALANNDHLDTPQTPISSQEWDLFVQDYVKAVHHENGFVETTDGPPFPEIEMLYVTANAVLKRVKDVDPQFELNGHRNIWILKPSDLCCGTGIVMTHKLHHIMKRVHESARDYFVVQKYIEKPLLVQDTKFDVRQWYLVTKSYPLTIWIYKESFLRFSSRPFSFSNYHEAVHICNTAVQCKYNDQRNSVRAKNWDCEKINDYLKKAGFNGEPWYDRVHPKICEAIIATMLTAQQHMDKRRASFELYGADFVIMNDLSVWLIEINTNPRMHPPSTKVTERLYPDVMESLVKVVLDYPESPNADTGNFFLAYEQNVTNFQPYLGASMFVLGKATNQRPKNFNDPENSINSWTPLLKERRNRAALLFPRDQKVGNPNFPNASHLYR